MNMTKREKTLVLIVLVLAVLCVYYIYSLKPYLAEMEELTSEKSNKETQVTSLNQQQARIAQLDAEIADMEAQLSEYNGTISQGFDQPPILAYLEETVNDHTHKGMFVFEQVVPAGQMEVCTMTATLTGTYAGLKDLLSELSDGPYFIKVTKLNVAYGSVQPVLEDDETPVASEPPAADGQTSDEQPADEQTSDENETITLENTLEITLTLEFYSKAGDIPPDTTYEFDDDSLETGGDIFF